MNKKNNSVMKCNICENRNIGEFIVINNKKYHLCCIENLQQENTQLKQQLKETNNCLNLQIANVTLLEKELKDKDEKISEIIEYIKENIKAELLNGSIWIDKCKLLNILESNKED